MAEQPIQNCEVRFQFQCPKQWDALQPTAEPGVRACSQCQKSVYFCQSAEEAAQHAQLGHCIAVPSWLSAPQDSPEEFERLQELARQHGVPAVRLRGFRPDPELLKRVGLEMARKYTLLPVGQSGSVITLALSDPTNRMAIDDVRFYTGYNVKPVVASQREILAVIDQATQEDRSYVELGVVDERAFLNPKPAPARLSLISEDGVEWYVHRDRFVIGRGKDCDFQPDSLLLSRHHAVIVREDEDYFLEDLASTSGVWLGRERLQGRHRLGHGDEFTLADVKLRAQFRR